MMGERESGQDRLFYGFSLERHVPDDHIRIYSSSNMYHMMIHVARDTECKRQVCRARNNWFIAAWANYTDAKPPTLKLMPHDGLKQKLRTDYQAMNEMIFGEAPSFETVMDVLKGLHLLGGDQA